MSYLENLFIRLFDVNHVGLELLELIDEDRKDEYFMNKISSNITKKELKKELKDEMTKQELKYFLSELY